MFAVILAIQFGYTIVLLASGIAYGVSVAATLT